MTEDELNAAALCVARKHGDEQWAQREALSLVRSMGLKPAADLVRRTRALLTENK